MTKNSRSRELAAAFVMSVAGGLALKAAAVVAEAGAPVEAMGMTTAGAMALAATMMVVKGC